MRSILLLLLGSLLSPALSQSPPPRDRPTPPRVRLRMLSELDAVRGGEEFLVGLSYKILPHWHIYWKNPGDSGLATQANLQAPPGFEVGPLLFPGPERIRLPGDLISFAYEDEVVLFWRVTAPEELGEARSFEFEASSEWLVCKEECERGEGDARLELRRAADDEAVARDTERFGESYDRLPQPLAALETIAVSWEGSRDKPVLILDLAEHAKLTMFPEVESGLEWDRTTLESGDQRVIMRRWYSLRPSEKHPLPRVRGLLAVERDDRTAFYELDLTRPRAAEKETR